MARPTDLPLGEAYEHGTRARYVSGCKCAECRKANVALYHERQKRSKEAALDREILPPVSVTRTWKGPKGELKTRTYQNGCPGIESNPCPTESTIRKDSIGGICGGCRGKLVWNGLVSAKAARKHLVWLSRNGVGRRAVHSASDVADTVLADITSRKKKNIRTNTEKAILAVDLSCASDGAWTPSKESWVLIEKMKKMEMTSTEIARRLGSRAKRPALQIGEKMVLLRTAAKIKRLWKVLEKEDEKARAARIEKRRLADLEQERLKRLEEEKKELDRKLKAMDGICPDCGYSHEPANRQRLIKRMVLEGFEARPIKLRWPCFYPHIKTNDAADRKVHRDINAVKEKEKEK